jgi:hypothetical protein
MLDPMTALSLVGNIIQVIDFSAKLVTKGHELNKSADGASVGNAELELIANDLQELHGRLKSSQVAQTSTIRLAGSDIALQKLSEQCSGVAEELIDTLENLKVHGTAHRRWKSFRQALKGLLKTEEVDAIAKRLQNLREELSLHILVSMRYAVPTMHSPASDFGTEFTDPRWDYRETLDMQAIKQTEGFRELNQSSRELVQRLEKEQDQLHGALKGHTEHLSYAQTNTQELILSEHERTRRTILDFIQFSRANQPLPRSQDPSKEAKDAIRKDKEKDREIEDVLLTSLRFPTMDNRAEDIEPAHLNTLEWVFRSPEKHSKWSNFPQWLSKGNGIYWINGKAASGKSTLMRFICEHPQTVVSLKEWSGSKPLIKASHFFWNSGAVYQRSYEGLLRGLLVEILQELRHLIREVFPGSWAALRSQPTISAKAFESWTVRRLSNAFTALFQRTNTESMICLFVDGLDEYADDPLEIINLFTTLSELPNVKLCLSSRPLYEFVTSFRSFPTLRLQDLNFPDIKQYVDDKLRANDRMQELQRQEPEQAPRLSLEIIEKADGVFLWVKLVVHSLLRGLRYSDHISDLERRLHLLPPKLEDLFSHMLGRLEPVYLTQSSRIFQIFAASRLADTPFTSLELSFAEEPDAQSLLSSRSEPMSETERTSRIARVDIWLATRCGGLIEARPCDGLNPSLSYLHRTVRDFLELPQVWSRVLEATRESDFNPYLSLLQSSVLFIRFILDPCPFEIYFEGERENMTNFAAKSLAQAYLAESKTNETSGLLLDELGKDLLHLAHSQLPCCKRGDRKLLNIQAHEHELLTIAISNGLHHYVAQKLERQSNKVWSKTGRPLLQYALDSPTVGELRLSSEMVDMLLLHASRLNQAYEIRSAWFIILKKLTEFGNGLLRPREVREYASLELLKIVRIFVSTGVVVPKDIHEKIDRAYGDSFRAEVRQLHSFIVAIGGPNTN